MKQHVFKPRRKLAGKPFVAREYSGRYRLAGDQRDTQVALKVTDKQVARAKLAEIVLQKEKERQGLAAPARQTETAAMALTDVIREWLGDLRAKGTGSHHVSLMEKRLGVLIRGCDWQRVRDIRPDSFIQWRSSQCSNKAAKTLNDYLGAVRALLNWLVRTGRLPANPLAGVQDVETRGREVRNRRAFGHDEFLRLLSVSGPVRSVVYATAYYTGLRRSELASLTWGDFNLAADIPTFTIHAKHAKNRTTVTLPLHPHLKEMLLEHHKACGSPATSENAFAVPQRLYAFHQDLKAAGIAKQDASGRILDFHSLRHSCATRLASLDVPLPVSMRLMRHSDPKLTAKAYVDAAAIPMAQFVAKLPGMRDEQRSLIHSPESDVSGQRPAHAVALPLLSPDSEASLVELLRRTLSQLGERGQKVGPVGFEPTTKGL